MPSPFFAYEDFDREIERKLDTLTAPTPGMLEALNTALVSHQVLPGGSRVLDDFATEIQNTDADFEYENYLNHPIRVTASYFLLNDYQLGPEEIRFAMAHNALEIGIMDQLGLDAESREKIRTITIDRSRERDPGYRAAFYDGIEDHSPGLLGFKALDKLDNTFWWVLLDLESYHADVVLEEVCPRLEKHDTRLADYLGRLTRYVLDEEPRRRFRQKYAHLA